MSNRQIQQTWAYHNQTKHSYWSVRTTAHHLDWHNMPSPFKIYPELEPLSLPRDLIRTGSQALSVIGPDSQIFADDYNPVTLGRLASLLYYSAGVTKKKSYPGGEIFFRAAACAGALYPVEIYVVCRELDELPAGVYHFNPGDFALRQLRTGDLRSLLVEATGGYQRVESAPALLVLTAISWRSTWKYRDRAYRYHFWDSGMILANALAMADAHRLPHQLVLGFVDGQVNRLIGIDGQKELPLSILALGQDQSLTIPPAASDIPDLNPTVLPLSHAEVEYPSILQMHQSSSLESTKEVKEWRAARINPIAIKGSGKTIPLAGPQDGMESESIEDVIQRRASTRRFAQKPISFSELSVILDRATRGITADFEPSGGSHLNQIYLIVHRVEGLRSGAYVFRPSDRELELLKEGDFSEEAARLSLDQELGGSGAATLFFMADLKPLLASHGNRAYRAVQLEAGIIGGKVYLATYALRRGATGLTFYDDEVTDFLSPDAGGKSTIFEVAIGVPGKRPLM